MGKVLTTCGFCGCGCGIFLDVEDGRVIGVAPQKAHPTSKGTLCFKGWNGFRALRHPDRLKRPLIRTDDGWREVKWSEAVDRVVRTLRDIVEKHGPEAVGVVGSTKITNEEAFLLGRFARSCLGTNHVDTAARLTHGPTLAVFRKLWGGLGHAARILDVPESDLILLVGENPKEQAARVGAYVLRAAKDGKPLVVVDPRRTDLATFATVHLQVRPGTDAVLLLGLIREILSRELAKAEPEGVEDLRRVAEAYTLERVAADCGVAAEDVHRVADLLAAAERPVMLYGAGVTGHLNGSAVVALLADLALLLNVRTPEWGALLPVHHSNNERGACDFGLLPDMLPGYRPVNDADAQDRFAKAWGTKPPATPGKSLGEMLRAAAQGELKALYVVGENLLRLWPNTGAVREALNKLELLVVQDLFLNDTAQQAHVVLPAAAFAEKEGTVTSLEGRVQALRKAVDAPGEARPDLEILLELMAKFGHKVKERTPEQVFAQMVELVPGYEGITWQGVREKVGGELVRIAAETAPKLLVPDLRDLAEAPDEEYPLMGFVGSPPFHWRTGTMVEHSHTLAREYPEPEVWMNSEEAREQGLRGGTVVRLVTRRGAVERTLRVSRDVPRGAIFVPLHYRRGLTNEILPDELEPESKAPAMRSFAGKLEKAG